MYLDGFDLLQMRVDFKLMLNLTDFFKRDSL